MHNGVSYNTLMTKHQIGKKIRDERNKLIELMKPVAYPTNNNKKITINFNDDLIKMLKRMFKVNIVWIQSLLSYLNQQFWPEKMFNKIL